MTKTKKGFTLIELVIVVAALAIIAAIAIPTVVGAINNARETKITANINSIASAVNTAVKLSEDYMELDDRMRIPGDYSFVNEGAALEIEKSVLEAVGDKLNGKFLVVVEFTDSPSTDTVAATQRYNFSIFYNEEGLGVDDEKNGYTYYAGEITKGIKSTL